MEIPVNYYFSDVKQKYKMFHFEIFWYLTSFTSPQSTQTSPLKLYKTKKP